MLRAQGGGVQADRSPARPCAVDDLAGAAPQRGDPRRPARLPGVDRAVEGRAGGAASEDGEARRATSGCASTCRSGSSGAGRAPGRRRRCAGPVTCAGWAATSRAAGPPLGDGVEPGADRQPAAGSTSPMMSRCGSRHEAIYQALYVQGRGALQPRAGRLPAHRAGAAGSAGPQPKRGKGVRHARGDDQRAAGRGRRPCRARPLGRRPDHRARAAPRSARWSSAPPGSRCCCTCPAWTATARARESRTGRRSPATAPRPCATRIAATITTLPEQLRRSLTWDQGAEMAQHAQLTDRHRPADLLLRPAQPLAARHEREHQRPAAPVLPERHRPVQTQPRRPRRRRRRAQQPTAQDPRLEDTRRGPRRAATSLQQAGVATTG